MGVGDTKAAVGGGVTDDAVARKRVDDYMMNDSEFSSVPPFQEAIEVIRKLGQHHELHIVTGRPDFLTEATHHMLQTYFPDIFSSVEFTNFFSEEKSRPKSKVCQDLGADLLIDDHIHHARVVAECGTDVLLFGDYPWNQADELPTNIRRVSGWREIGELLLPKN